MTQDHRNKLYDLAYKLDNIARVKITDKQLAGDTYPVVNGDKLTRARMQEKTRSLYVLFSSDELERLAQSIRDIVSQDEQRIADGHDNHHNHR